MSWLTENCPRLARAHAAQRQVLEARARREARKVEQVHELERVVAHRELQLLRAGSTGDGRYVKRRSDKLATARAALAHVRRDLRLVGSWEPEEFAA